MNKILLIAMIMLVSHFCYGQSVIKSGDKSIRYELISPRIDNYKIMMIDSAGKVLSEFSSRITVSVNKAKGWVVLAQDHYLPDGRRLLDSTVADLGTLSPVWMSMQTMPDVMSMKLDFKPKQVYAMAEMRGIAKDTLHTMPDGYFDSNFIEYLFGLLPYKQGFKASINAYTYELQGTDPFEVSYVGQDMLVNPNKGLIWCYVAEIGHKGKAGYGLAWYEQSTGVLLKRIVPVGKGFYVVSKV